MTVINTKWRSLTEPARASIATAGCRVFMMAVSILATPVFTRLMTTEEYGTYTVIFSWLGVVHVFATLNIAGGSLQQALVKYDNKKNEIMAAVAGLGTAASLATFAVYLMFRKWLDPVFGFGPLIFGCIIVLSWAVFMSDIWTDYQKIGYRYRAKIFVSILIAVVETLVGIAAVHMARQNRGEVRFFSVVLVETLVYGCFLIYFITKGKLYDRKLWRYFLSLSIPLLPHYLTGIVLSQSDRIMIKQLVGESEAGIYGLGRSLAWSLWLVTSAVIYSMKPWLFKKIKSKDLDSVGKKVYLMLALVALAGLCIVLVTPEALYILAPEEYHAAKAVVAPLAVSVYFIFVYELFSCFEFYYEKTGMITLASLMAGILNIALNYILIGKFGWAAAGFTTLICHGCLAIVHYVNMSVILKKTGTAGVFNPPVILLISAAFIAFGGILTALYDHAGIRYGIALTVMMIILLKRRSIMRIVGSVYGKDDRENTGEI